MQTADRRTEDKILTKGKMQFGDRRVGVKWRLRV